MQRSLRERKKAVNYAEEGIGQDDEEEFRPETGDTNETEEEDGK